MVSSSQPLLSDLPAASSSGLDWFVRQWLAPRRWVIFAGVCLVLVNLAVFAVGVPRMNIFGHDVFVSLDGGWRVFNGQRPVVDFFSQMGPLYFLLHATGLALAGGDAIGLGYGSAIAGVLIALWSFLLLRRRMFPAAFFLACLAITLLAVSPSPLGYDPWRFSFSMKHNRYCFALSILVLLESFLPPPADEKARGSFAGGFSTGLACGLMFFIKISYGLVGLGIAAVSFALRPREHARTLGIAAGFVAGVLPVLIWLRFDLGALFREYRLLAAIRGAALSPAAIARSVFDNRFETGSGLLLALVAILLPAISARRRLMIATASLLAAGAGVLLLLTNTQDRSLPLLAGIALLIVNELSALLDPRAPESAAAFTLCFALLAAVLPLATDAAVLSIALGDKWLEFKPAYRLEAPHLAGPHGVDTTLVVAPFSENDNGRMFVDMTSEAIALVEANSTPSESVRGLGMSNPFSYAMLRPPSHGGAVNMVFTGNVGAKTIIPVTKLFGDVDLLLVPYYPASERDTLATVLARYPQLLGTTYALVASSPHWKLYRRRVTVTSPATAIP